jgi:hypothetical protein
MGSQIALSLTARVYNFAGVLKHPNVLCSQAGGNPAGHGSARSSKVAGREPGSDALTQGQACVMFRPGAK